MVIRKEPLSLGACVTPSRSNESDTCSLSSKGGGGVKGLGARGRGASWGKRKAWRSWPAQVTRAETQGRGFQGK